MLGIVSNADGDANGADMAWEKWSDNEWHTMNEAWNSQNDGDFDLALFPVLCSQNVTGINGEELEFSLFPNPTNGDFVLLNTQGISGVLEVYNSLGQVVTSSSIQGETAINVSLAGNQSGVYLIRVSSEKGRWIGRLILQ